MANTLPPLVRARAFCDAFALRLPILMAPMAGACPASLAIAVANAGGLGGCGALLMKPEAIRAWAADVRAQTNGSFQIRSEEHTSELQSHSDLVCRLLLEKKNIRRHA